MNAPPTDKIKEMVKYALTALRADVEDRDPEAFTSSLERKNYLVHLTKAQKWINSQEAVENIKGGGYVESLTQEKLVILFEMLSNRKALIRQLQKSEVMWSSGAAREIDLLEELYDWLKTVPVVKETEEEFII